MIYAIKTKMHMDPRLQGALILGAGGALGGGIGGHLVDRKAKRDGNWFNRNKSAIIGSLGGAAVGGGIGAYAGHLKKTRPDFDQETLDRYTNELKSKRSDILNSGAGAVVREENLNKLEEAYGKNIEKLKEKVANNKNLTPKEYKTLGLLSGGLGVGLAGAGAFAAHQRKKSKEIK
jgi:hypothetical protein